MIQYAMKFITIPTNKNAVFGQLSKMAVCQFDIWFWQLAVIYASNHCVLPDLKMDENSEIRNLILTQAPQFQ